MSLLHIRGIQPSKKNKKSKLNQRINNINPTIVNFQKNIDKILTTKKKCLSLTPSFGINNFMDYKSFSFFTEYFLNNTYENQEKQRININTQKCNNFFNKHNIDFNNEKTQELSGAKVLITTKTNRKRHNATFVLQLPLDYTDFLILLILLKIDFANMHIELSSNIGKNFMMFLIKAKNSGFKPYYDLIRLNIINKRTITIRF